MLDQRLSLVILAVGLALPVGGATGCAVLIRNLECNVSGHCYNFGLVYVALFVLGVFWVDNAASWLAGRLKRWHSANMPLVAVGTVGGVVLGMVFSDTYPIQAALGLAVFGAVLGAFVTRQRRGKVES